MSKTVAVAIPACGPRGLTASLQVDASAGTTIVADASYTTHTAFAPRGLAVQAARANNPGFQGPAVCTWRRARSTRATFFNLKGPSNSVWACLTRLNFKCGDTVLVRVAALASQEFAASEYSAPLEFAPACAPSVACGRLRPG